MNAAHGDGRVSGHSWFAFAAALGFHIGAGFLGARWKGDKCDVRGRMGLGEALGDTGATFGLGATAGVNAEDAENAEGCREEGRVGRRRRVRGADAGGRGAGLRGVTKHRRSVLSHGHQPPVPSASSTLQELKTGASLNL